MTRNIDQYVEDYTKENYNFENIMVRFRRKKILEVLNAYKPRHVLEVGCGINPLFNDYQEFDSFTVIEPSEQFCRIAKSFVPPPTLIKNTDRTRFFGRIFPSIPKQKL